LRTEPAIGKHPDDAKLAAFVNGRLPEDASRAIEAHLLTCDACTAVLDGLPDDDPLVASLRDAGLALEAAPPALKQGESIGAYKVLDELGRGGVGVVYRALDTRLDREIALKVIPEGVHADPRLRERLVREAKVTAGLRHPGIVQIHEVGEHEGSLFLALELLEPDGLGASTDRRARPARWSAQVVRHLAETMDYAHRRGLIHRDLKPGNILLDPHATGEPEGDREPALPSLKIADFGLALLSNGRNDLTQDGLMMGTPDYMAPEQIPGVEDAVGAAADIYALGVILYELLTGQRPFRGESVIGQIRLVRDADPRPPRAIVPGLPRDLETICLKCLEKRPEQRYGSAGELAGDLGLYLDGEPIRARPPALHRRVFAWARRKPMLATSLVIFASFYLLHLAVMGSVADLPRADAFHRHVTLITPLMAAYAWAAQRVLEIPGRRLLGEYMFALLPPVALFLAFFANNGPSSGPIPLYHVAVAAAVLIRPVPRMVWFEVAACMISYGAMSLMALRFAPDTAAPATHMLSVLVSLPMMGVAVHLYLRRDVRALVGYGKSDRGDA